MNSPASTGIAAKPRRFATKKDARGYLLTLPDGSAAEIRPIRPDDHDALIAFHRSLSDQTVYLRYFSPLSIHLRTDETHIAQELCNDPDHHMTMVVERTGADSCVPEIVGVGRLILHDHNRTTAELGMTIRDDVQGVGLGAALLDALIAFGRTEHLRAITACVLYHNSKMLQLCREHGFHIVSHEPGGPVQLALDLHKSI